LCFCFYRFVVSEHVRELLDYNVGQLNLVAERSKVTFIHPDFGSCRDVPLSLVSINSCMTLFAFSSLSSHIFHVLSQIIMDPGDLAVSILRSADSEENGAASSDSPHIHLMW